MLTEPLIDRHEWWRIADPGWDNPVDPTFAQQRGGRWNAPGSHPTLYLNEDVVTARMNMELFSAKWPFEPQDLRPEHAPVLVGVTLPRNQTVADAHTPNGLASLGLPSTYPIDAANEAVSHDVCQAIGGVVHQAGFRGMRCRSATSPLGEGRELAWFPATSRSRATVQVTRSFDDWFWA